MSGGEGYDIFLSHAHEDGEAARRLAEDLASHGWAVTREAADGAPRTAKVVLVLWSPRSVGSHWVQITADHAFERDAYIPVQIDACAVPERLRHVQVTELGAWAADPRRSLPEVLTHALARRLRSSTAGRPTEQGRFRAAPRLARVFDDDSAELAADRVLRLTGSVPGGQSFEISVHLSQLRAKPDGLVIGRVTGQCDIVVAHPSVSRRHALLRVGGGRLILSDLGSTNGTLINSVHAGSTGIELLRGAIVRMGDVELKVDGIGR